MQLIWAKCDDGNDGSDDDEYCDHAVHMISKDDTIIIIIKHDAEI